MHVLFCAARGRIQGLIHASLTLCFSYLSSQRIALIFYGLNIYFPEFQKQCFLPSSTPSFLRKIIETGKYNALLKKGFEVF